MEYKKIVKGIFRERPNRFIAYVDVEGMDNKEIAETMHYSYGYVKNLIARIFSKLEIEKRRELKKIMIKE